MPRRTDHHLMLPRGLLLHFEPDSLLLFQNKALGGQEETECQGPVWLIPGSDRWGSSCGRRRVLVGD